jgi:hypothetical protein
MCHEEQLVLGQRLGRGMQRRIERDRYEPFASGSRAPSLRS